jgi:hypothetical protein
MSEDEEPTLNRAQRRAAKKGGAKGDQSSAKSRIQDLAASRGGAAARPNPKQTMKSTARTTGSQRGG